MSKVTIDNRLLTRDKEQTLLAIKDCRYKLYSALGPSNTGTSDATREACNALSDMPIAERSEFILQQWGPVQLSRAESVIFQLAKLEESYIKISESIIKLD